MAENTVSVPDGSLGDWTGALAAVRRELGSPAWRAANVRVIVADHWVRYAVAPWSADLDSDAERLAHGRLVLQQIYGDDLAGMTVALADTAPRRAQLVCAMPSQLRSDLNLVLAEAGLRLVSLQPHLVVAFNRWRSRMSADGGWFVTIDEGSLAAVRLERDSWQEVHCVRIGDDWSSDLRRLQTFGRLASGRADGGRVLVDAPPWLRRVAATAGDQLEWLEPDGRIADTLEKLAQLKEAHA
ncbi:MAG: hypothetical protein IT483_07255 [Gammaproteobacteria bacterium]|nr:hypothetical protein [Gammaproteobacteria bacterium]